MLKKSDLIVPLSSISNEDKDTVGEKAAKLGEMIKLGLPFPNGFVITPNAYRQFLLKYAITDKLIKEIFRAYKRLERPLKDATVEILLSLPTNSKVNPVFQKKEVMDAKGEAVLLEKIKFIWNSFLTSSDYLNVSPAIVVRKIPQFSLSGIVFTTNSINNDKTKVVIKEKSGNYYEVLKKDLKISSKNISKGKKQLLADKKLIEVAKLGVKLQKYYYFPQEVHFAIEKNKIYITQTKPLTTFNHQMHNVYQKPKHNVLLTGKPFYPGIATGHLRIIQSMQDIDKILRGEIIVIPYQDLIKRSIIKAGAIVATDDRVHHMSHLTLGRFFSGKPALITTPNEAKMLKNGAVVTVNGKSGELHLG